MLVTAVQQNESVTRTHIPPFWVSLRFRSPQCIKQSSQCFMVHPSAVYFIHSISSVAASPQSPSSSPLWLPFQRLTTDLKCALNDIRQPCFFLFPRIFTLPFSKVILQSLSFSQTTVFPFPLSLLTHYLD